MHRLRVLLGTVLAATGIAAIIFGGLIAGAFTTAGHYPHGLLGFGVIIGGLAVMYAGLWLCGVDLT